jgi:RHS repeat-associated protein
MMQKTTPEDTIDYIYDAGSRLQSVTAPEGAISYTYDTLNRVNTVSYPGGKNVSYEYDANGNRTKLTYPDSTYITYEYDNMNRLTDIKDVSSQAIGHYSYDALSRRTGKTLLNGTSATYAYDAVNRLTQLDQLAQPTQYTYDNVGNRKTMTTPDGDHNYTYDNLYQLKSADYPAASTFPDTTFNYDPVGNRTSLVSSATTNYTSNNLNQYAQVGPVNLIYDLNGNLTSIATNSYSYDSENRLTSATTASHTASYGYDPFGRRISKTVDGVTTKFLYDGDQIIAEYDGSDNMTAKYVYGAGIDEVLMGLTPQGSDPNKERYYHYDGLGSVTAITDSAGTVAESYSYDVFGKPSAVSTVGNRYMFTGREYDVETGLYYYRARMYSPELGRFLQTDPIGYRAGINLYTYCSNNPLNFVDPLGWDKIKKDRPWLESLELYLGEVGAEMEKDPTTNMQDLMGIMAGGASAYSGVGLIPKAIGYSNQDFIQGGRTAYNWANQYGSGVKVYSWAGAGALSSALAIASAGVTGWTIGATLNAYYWGYQNYKAKYRK